MLLLQFSDIKLLHPRRSGPVSVFLTNGACRSFKTVDQKNANAFKLFLYFFRYKAFHVSFVFYAGLKLLSRMFAMITVDCGQKQLGIVEHLK